MKTRIIHKGRHYTACKLPDGSVVVTNNRKGGGKRLVGPQAATWAHYFETAEDHDEGEALCRGFLQ